LLNDVKYTFATAIVIFEWIYSCFFFVISLQIFHAVLLLCGGKFIEIYFYFQNKKKITWSSHLESIIVKLVDSLVVWCYCVFKCMLAFSYLFIKFSFPPFQSHGNFIQLRKWMATSQKTFEFFFYHQKFS
jgi:hypothetical protein